MKTEIWNGHTIRFVEHNGKMKANVNDFLSALRELTDGMYISIADMESVTSRQVPYCGELIRERDDGRVYLRTLWSEIDEIATDKPFTVYADIRKAYGINTAADMFNALCPPRERTEQYKDGCIYIVNARGTSLYKIGYASNVGERMHSMRTDSPLELDVIAVIPAREPRKMESRLHRKYEKKRVRGEWFNLSNDDVVELSTVKDKYGLDISVSEQIYKGVVQ